MTKWVILQKNYARVQFLAVTINYASTTLAQDNKWLIDSVAFHNITGDLSNLSIHSKYVGTDEIVIDDGSSLQVSHIGSMVLHSPTWTFCLKRFAS